MIIFFRVCKKNTLFRYEKYYVEPIGEPLHYNPGWIGCQQMDAVTYPDKKVSDFIKKNLIALRIPADTKPYCADFNITWTPTLIVLDKDGKEHHRSVGFLSPEELIPALLLGMIKTRFEQQSTPKPFLVSRSYCIRIPGAGQHRKRFSSKVLPVTKARTIPSRSKSPTNSWRRTTLRAIGRKEPILTGCSSVVSQK